MCGTTRLVKRLSTKRPQADLKSSSHWRLSLFALLIVQMGNTSALASVTDLSWSSTPTTFTKKNNLRLSTLKSERLSLLFALAMMDRPWPLWIDKIVYPCSKWDIDMERKKIQSNGSSVDHISRIHRKSTPYHLERTPNTQNLDYLVFPMTEQWSSMTQTPLRTLSWR